MTLYLSINNITKSFGYHAVLNQVSMVLNDGERIGLVGANGVGKSTLLKIITGVLEADSGTISYPPGITVGYLEQTITETEGKTLDDMIADALHHLLALESRMRHLESRMTTTSGDDLDAVMEEYGDVSSKFERHGGYDMDYRVDQVLAGLGVGHIGRARVFDTLSGGEKSRVALALLLLQAPDVLLLDEPTNHLDFASLNWLEDYLQAYRGGVLIVSHDRHFLNRTVNAIVEIDEHSRQAKRYSGNYDIYHQAKVMERRKWEADFAAQQEEIKVLRYEVKVGAHRNDNDRIYRRLDGDKFARYVHKQNHERTVSKRINVAEERLKRIEADPIPRPPDELRFDPDFDPQALRGRHPLSVSGITKAFGSRLVLDGITFTLDLHSRVVLVGPNGAGKSTLLKILMGLEQADAGEITINPAVNIGYLHQEQGLLDPDQTVFEAYSAGLPGHDQQLKAILLSSGLFRYDDLDKRVGVLSSGQERKLQIARLMAGRTNLLILDEPTNYVSFDVLEGLENALKDFPGPVLAASHDRRFMQQFGGQIWELRDGQIIRYLDGYAEYMAAVGGRVTV